MAASTTNPFNRIIEDLSLVEYRVVTLHYLDWIRMLLKPYDISPETYGDVFKVLEYLAEHGAVDLQQENELHIVRKGACFGKNNF